jgi:hypothetical protein
MIRILIDATALASLVILTAAAVIQTLALVKLVRADTKRWKAEAEAHGRRATDRPAWPPQVPLRRREDFRQ